MADVNESLKVAGAGTASDDSPPSGSELDVRLMFIGGEWVQSRSGRTRPSINPANGRPWALVPEADASDVDDAVSAARQAFDSGVWSQLTATERGRRMRRLAELIGQHADHLARLESTDNGKVLRESLGQLRRLPDWYEYFAGAADKVEGSTIPVPNAHAFVYTRAEPIGVVGAVLPWNSPLFLLAFKLAPALAAGCTFVAKPSEHTPVSTLEFAALVEEAGIPAGVFNVVTGDGPTVGHALVAHPSVDKVAFTGSTQTGKHVMKTAADNVARVTLELGGKSPNIVFPDADLDAAVNGAVAAIFAAAGQTCIAGSRLLVHEDVHDDLVDRLVERAGTIRMGDPLAPDTDMGPIAFQEQLDKVENYVKIGTQEGATLACGGHRPSEGDLADGFFFEPTIFTQATNEMRVAREEIFGPVLSVIPFRTETDAIEQANDSSYGLAAGVWTADVRRAHRVAHALRVGTVWINCYRLLSFNVPQGGFGASGIGRENGLDAIREYTENKSVWIELSDETRDPFQVG